MRIKITTKCFQNITRSFFHFKIKHMVLQYKQEIQNMNHEKPLLYHVFQLKFGQVYSACTSFRSYAVSSAIYINKLVGECTYCCTVYNV
jgi:hypothetical protein